MPVSKDFFVTNSIDWECWEFIGTFLVKNVIILIFWHKPFLKDLYPDNNVHLIFVMLQINKTKQNIFDSGRKLDVLFMLFKKSEIASNFYQFLKQINVLRSYLMRFQRIFGNIFFDYRCYK